MDDSFKELVRESFSKCKNDIESLKESNSAIEKSFNEEIYRLKEENIRLKEDLLNLKSELNELKSLVSNFLSSEKIGSKEVNEISSKSNSVKTKTTRQMRSIEKVQFKDPYEALMSYKQKKNKKKLIQQKIVQVLEENGTVDSSELKYILVDHYQLCSKATFYNYLKEIELKGVVYVRRVDGRNIISLEEMKISND